MTVSMELHSKLGREVTWRFWCLEVEEAGSTVIRSRLFQKGARLKDSKNSWI